MGGVALALEFFRDLDAALVCDFFVIDKKLLLVIGDRERYHVAKIEA